VKNVKNIARAELLKKYHQNVPNHIDEVSDRDLVLQRTGMFKSKRTPQQTGGEMKNAKTEKQKSVELRNGQIIYGNHYSKNGVTYTDSGASIANKLISRKNGKKFNPFK